MTNVTKEQGAYHVVLIGIDAYEKDPLLGCVNDIDSIQRVLLRAKIPADRITRLVSPHPDYVPPMTIEAQAATLENIVAALARLASDSVTATDRVFIYYAGHGTRVEIDDSDSPSFRGSPSRFREALVPVDGSLHGPTLLLDHELNELLANITKRTRAVTVVLDCCNSSGATRSLEPPGGNTRFTELTDDGAPPGPVQISDDRAQLVSAAVRAHASAALDATDSAHVDDCQIVAACLNHERAKETPKKVAAGETRSGLLTRSLTEALAEIPDDELTTATWGRFWNQVRARIESDPETPEQHSWMSGGLARAWLAGPPNDGDVGLGVTRTQEQANEYVINAGTVAGVTKGAQIAVYGVEPFKFAPLGSEEDESVRIGGLLEVAEASPSSAKAVAMGDAFDLPVGARGRLVQPGESERLRCAVVPHDPAIAAAIGESNLLEVATNERAIARLEREEDGAWALTDDVHGARPDDPVLIRLGPDEVANEARHVFEHYIRYAGPIRMAQRCGDLPNALHLDLLHCPPEKLNQDGKIDESEIANLSELQPETDGSYALLENTHFCVRIHNTSRDELLVHLFNSDAAGTVAVLGQQEIDGRTVDHFWLNGERGAPFYVEVPTGATRCIDRFVAIGTTDMKADLKHLVEHGHFRREPTRALGGLQSTAPPAVQWTAVERIVRTNKSVPTTASGS